jgi:hypothetical protein
MRPIPSPSFTTGNTGGAVDRGAVVVVGAVSEVVERDADDVVVDSTTGLSRNCDSNWRFRSFWARAVKMPVPQSWYATKSRISSPTVTSIRPTLAAVLRTMHETTGGR